MASMRPVFSTLGIVALIAIPIALTVSLSQDVTFERPWALASLWALPLLIGLFALSMRRRAALLRRFADERLLPLLVPAEPAGRTALRALLLGTAALGLSLALAGPRWGFRWEQVERKGVDLIVALDLSRSMLATDIPPNRLTAAKREIRDLLDLLQGDRIGLVVFAGTAFVQCPLTLDYGAFEVFLDQLDPDWMPVGGTDVAGAVRISTASFPKDERAGRAVLLITDGEDHSGEVQKAAEEAKAEGVHVFVVGIGSPEGAPIPDGAGGFVKEGGNVVLTKLDEPGLKELASTTDASYVRGVAGDLDLRRVYQDDIKGALEARALSASRQRRWEERFQWALLPALFFLLVDSLLPAGRSRRAVPAVMALLLYPGPANAAFWSRQEPLDAGWAAFEAGQWEEAVTEWRAAQVDAPGDRRLDFDIATALYRAGKFPDAEQAFRRAAEADDTGLAADAWYGAGNACFQQGRFKEAVAAFERALELRPDDADAAHNRDLAQRKYEEMLEQAQQQEEEREQQPEQAEQEEQDQQQAGEPEDGDGGEEQQGKQQQQGQGMSDAQAEAGEGEAQDEGAESQPQQPGQDPSQGEAKPGEVAEGGAASAADIERDAAADGQQQDGAVASQTEATDGQEPQGPAPTGTALTKEQADALLQALAADQQRRQQERTRREAGRGRRAARQDW